MSMMLIGGLVNAQAGVVEFTGYANPNTWYIVGRGVKTGNIGLFGASPRHLPNTGRDTLYFAAVAEEIPKDICQLVVDEGYTQECRYPDWANANEKAKVTSEVRSKTWSATNFPIEGTLNYY